jgi:ATP-dependent exoDNAse (exonuclease V) beta subunit
MNCELFDRIVFNPDDHSYHLDGMPLTSVSRIVKSLQLPFDREGVAAKTAKKRGMSVESVLAEWDVKRELALLRGTRTHWQIQARLVGNLPARDLPTPDWADEISAFEDWLAQHSHLQVARTELVVGCPELGIAGTLDAVMRDGDQLVIWDWKTGEKFDTDNRWQRLLPPFADLPDCELMRYSLQTSLYRLLVERHAGVQLVGAFILHLSQDGHWRVHEALDLRERLIEWFQAGQPTGVGHQSALAQA